MVGWTWPAPHPGHGVTMGMMNSLMSLPLHLGSLHTVETVLLVLLAFGPFAVLAVVVHTIRRRDIAADRDERREPAASAVEPPDRRG